MNRHFSGLLGDILPLKGYAPLKKDFEYFVSDSVCGWFGWCDVCETEMEIYIYRNYVYAQIETDDGQQLQTPVEPISPECLIGISKWLYETAEKQKMDDVACRILCMLGKVKCLGCGKEFQMPEYIGMTESFQQVS